MTASVRGSGINETYMTGLVALCIYMYVEYRQTHK